MSVVDREKVKYAPPSAEVSELQRKHMALCIKNRWSMDVHRAFDLAGSRYVSLSHPPKKGSRMDNRRVGKSILPKEKQADSKKGKQK